MVWISDSKQRLVARILLFVFAGLRVVLCAFSQNDWFSYQGSLLWGILRNIPFALMDIGIIVLCFIIAKQRNDKSYSLMGLMVILSFAFYIPVVLFADTLPIIGVLMIPKTLAYVGVVVIGLVKYKRFAKSIAASSDESHLTAHF